MGVKVGASDVYKGIEEKWYSLLDGLSAKGVPVYSIVDPIENVGIPSLPLVIGVGIIALALVAYALTAGGGMAAVDVSVTSNGTAMANATVAAAGLEMATDGSGTAVLELPKGEDVEVEASAPGCSSQKEIVTPPGKVGFDLVCKEEPHYAGCSTIAEEYQTMTVVGEGNTPLVGCNVTALESGAPVEIGWGIDGNTMFLDSSECLQDDYQIQISCLSHEKTMLVDDIRNEMLEKGEITIPLRETSGNAPLLEDCDHDGIPDKIDKDNDNDGIFDVDDMDIDGDGVLNAQDADSCGQDTRMEDYVPPADGGELEPAPGPQELDAETTYGTYITVISDTGEKLDGIQVTAVGSGDTEIDDGYANTVTQSSTVNGSATLVLPKGQKYYVIAEDTKNVYRPTKSQLVIQSRQQELRLVMQRGFPTTITVVGVPYATVRVLADPVMEKQADSSGKAMFVLDKGEEYTATVVHDDYIPLDTTITGGEDAQIVLQELNESNSGTIGAEVLNGQGIEEPMRGVKLELVTSTGVIYKSCKTTERGCEFRKTLAGEYTLRATPPGAIDYQESKKFTLNPGETAEQKMIIDPAEAEISILTKVLGNPTKDVHVTLYDISYGVPEKIASAKSGANRRVVFRTYRGKKAYIEAETKEYGPTTISPFTVVGNRELEINLKKVGRAVSLELPPEIAAAKTADAKLRIELPYADKEMKTKYKSVQVELWIGDPGRKENPLQTPVVFGAIDTYVFQKQQRPRVTVAAGDSYSFNEGAGAGDPGTTSKYLKFTITDYNPSTYEITVPLFARREAKGNTTIHYRATWTDDRRRIFTSNNGEWSEAGLGIIPLQSDDKADWIKSSGEFSSWNAFISNSPLAKGEENAEKPQLKHNLAAAVFFPMDYKPPKLEDEGGAPMFSDGSILYLHLRAIASKETKSYMIGLDSFPELGAGLKHLIPLAYRGVIRKTNGKARLIYPAKLAGKLPLSFSPTAQSKEYYSLDVNDEIGLVVALRADDPISSAEIALFNDLDHTLGFGVKEVANEFEGTSIANVEAKLRMLTTLCPSPPYSGECVTGETTAEQLLPSYDMKKAEGRNFTLVLELNNTEPKEKDVMLEINATGVDGLDAPASVVLPANGRKEIRVNGKGNSVQGGKIDIYMWGKGSEKELWKSIKHGPVDYVFELTGIDAEGNKQDTLDTHTKEIQLKVLRKTWEHPEGEEITGGFLTDGHADAIHIVKDDLDSWAGYRQDFEGGARYTTLPNKLSLGWGFLAVEAGHPEFGWLERSYEVHGSLIEPVTANNSFVLDDSAPNKSFNYATVTNNWDEELKVKLKPKRWEPAPQGQGYGLSKETRVFDAQGFEIEPESRDRASRDVPPRGKAELWISASPPGTGCNVAPSVNKLELETKTKSGVEDSGNYQVTFSCNFKGGPTSGEKMRANKVMREFTKPGKITSDSCGIVKDGKDVVAYVCDAEQFSVALMKGAAELENSDNIDMLKSYALGNDVVNPMVMAAAKRKDGVSYPSDVVYGEQGAGDNDLILSVPEITCGAVDVYYKKMTNGKIKATITQEPNVGWCGNGANAFMGLLNYDDSLRADAGVGKIVSYVGFTGDIDKMEASIAKYAPPKYFFGYLGLNDVKGDTEAPHVVYYKEWSADEFAASTDPLYKWLKPKYANTGYYSINKQGDVLIGLVYSQKDNLEKMRDCMFSNLVNFWMLGDSGSLRLHSNSKQAFDLDKCIAASGLKIPQITNMQLDSIEPTEVYDAKATGSATIGVELTTNMPVKACYIWNGKDDRSGKTPDEFTSKGYDPDSYPWKTDTNLVVDNWDLNESKDGLYTVKAACVSDEGIWSQRASKQIILDKTPPVISLISAPQTGIIPESTPPKTSEPVPITIEATDKYKISSCQVERTCPPMDTIVECPLGSPTHDKVLGNIYSSSCSTPPLLANKGVSRGGYGCSTPGYNDLNVTCTDEHGNTGSATFSTIMFMPDELQIWASCSATNSYGNMRIAGTGEECKRVANSEPAGHFNLYTDGNYYVNSPDLVIPITVTSTNPILSCSISNGTKGIDCDETGGSNSKYRKEYECMTSRDQADGTTLRLLSEGENSLEITCAQETDDPDNQLNPLELPPIVVDTNAPEISVSGDTFTTNGGHGPFCTEPECGGWGWYQLEDFSFTAEVNDENPNAGEVSGVSEVDCSIGGQTPLVKDMNFVKTSDSAEFEGTNTNPPQNDEFDVSCVATDMVGNENEASYSVLNRNIKFCPYKSNTETVSVGTTSQNREIKWKCNTANICTDQDSGEVWMCRNLINSISCRCTTTGNQLYKGKIVDVDQVDKTITTSGTITTYADTTQITYSDAYNGDCCASLTQAECSASDPYVGGKYNNANACSPFSYSIKCGTKTKERSGCVDKKTATAINNKCMSNIDEIATGGLIGSFGGPIGFFVGGIIAAATNDPQSDCFATDDEYALMKCP